MTIRTNVITNVLLAAIAVFLFMIGNRMPPSAGEIAAAQGADRRALMMKQPVVRATILDTIDVNVENSSFDVDVSNTPLEVTITR